MAEIGQRQRDHADDAGFIRKLANDLHISFFRKWAMSRAKDWAKASRALWSLCKQFRDQEEGQLVLTGVRRKDPCLEVDFKRSSLIL
jgi:hypothetical protein